SRTTPSRGTAEERTGAPTLMTKFANMPERSSCCESLISERTRTRRVLGSTLAPTVVILPSNTRPGKAPILTCTDCPTWNDGLSFSATFANIHIVSIFATVNGAGAAPGCTYNPGAALRGGAAIYRARHDKRRVRLAVGDNAVDLLIGLAE